MSLIKDLVIAYRWERLHRRLAAQNLQTISAAPSWRVWAVVLILVLIAFGGGCLVGSAAAASDRPASIHPAPELFISIYPTAVTASIQEGASNEPR